MEDKQLPVGLGLM